jgi:hypothetical protein
MGSELDVFDIAPVGTADREPPRPERHTNGLSLTLLSSWGLCSPMPVIGHAAAA